MQQRLLTYFTRQSEQFMLNFGIARGSYNADAIHDMRVAVKRTRAVYQLLEQLFPEDFDAITEEGLIRDLFRISGRIRDAQVQQQLLDSYAASLGTTFLEYTRYLQSGEKRAIRKFNKFLTSFDADSFLKQKQEKVSELISVASNDQIRHWIIRLTDALMKSAGEMRGGQKQDEHLHEIRRRLKQCQYLLTVFDQNDADYARLSKTMKSLDKVNDLLGDWHDVFVAVEMLDRFMIKYSERELSGENRYLLLHEKLDEKRERLQAKILGYFEEKLGI